MKIHYFQRYHKGEDVATANTMLLMSRLYSYSPNKFFQLLKDLFFSDIDFDPELSFNLQENNKDSRPDATIFQPSFKLVIETKLTDWFYQSQLMNHLKSFKNEQYKVLVTISSVLMESGKKEQVDKAIADYNTEFQTNIIHVNTTFEGLAQGIQEVLSDRDYDMQDVLDDYCEYCRNDGLIYVSDAWKKMRMQLAGTTFDFNIAENVYYDNIERGFSPHDYLGLYKQKSIRAVGKLEAVITAVLIDGELKYNVERGQLTEDRINKISLAIEDGKRYGYTLDANRFFFVDNFYETDFPKISKGASMGTRFFDLKHILQIEGDELPDTKTIADSLREKSWN